MAKKELKLEKLDEPVEEVVEEVVEVVEEPVKEVSGVKCHRCGNEDMQLEKDVKNEKVFVCLKCSARLSKMA